MSKIATPAIALAILLIGGPAHATAIYEWTTTAFTIGNPDPPDTFGGVSMTLGITDAAFRAGHLSAGTIGVPDVLECNATGIASFDGPLCPAGIGDPEQIHFSYDLSVVGDRLVGRFFVRFDTEEVSVASVTPALWRGIYGADSDALGCEGPPCTIEGAWRLVSAPRPVPGPSETALLVVGLAGVGVLSGRQRRAAG